MAILEKIHELEAEIRRTQKNKATEYHIGLLKAKIAKLRRNLISSSRSSGVRGHVFDVKKNGDATVSIIGFPSVGKSTLLTKITNAESKVAPYAFTTLSCIPGMFYYKGAKIQMLDLPGIIEGAKDGKGRGKEIIAVARNSDLLLILLDAQHPEQYKTIIYELEQMGIRLNQTPAQVIIKKSLRGGLTINYTVKLTKIDLRTVSAILNEYGVHNGDVIIRQDINEDQLIDVLENNRTYIPSLIAMNKIDLVDETELRKKFLLPFISISAEKNINLQSIIDAIYNSFTFIRIYTKPRGKEADLKEPLILKKGTNVEGMCNSLHRGLVKNFKYALIWGKSAKHPGQRVGLEHVLCDGDIVSIISKSTTDQ